MFAPTRAGSGCAAQGESATATREPRIDPQMRQVPSVFCCQCNAFDPRESSTIVLYVVAQR